MTNNVVRTSDFQHNPNNKGGGAVDFLFNCYIISRIPDPTVLWRQPFALFRQNKTLSFTGQDSAFFFQLG